MSALCKSASVVLIGALLASAGTAKEPLSRTPDDLSVQAVHNYAACIADTTPRGAVELLALDYRSPEYAKKMHALAQGHNDGRCISTSFMRSSQVLLAGGMAERLLLARAKPAYFPSLVAYDATKPPIAVRNPAEMTAICVVRAEPSKTFTLFQTEPTTKDETRAMQAIGPALLDCVKAGQKMSFNKPGLRAMLALAAYRLAQPEQLTAASKPATGAPVSR